MEGNRIWTAEKGPKASDDRFPSSEEEERDFPLLPHRKRWRVGFLERRPLRDELLV